MRAGAVFSSLMWLCNEQILEPPSPHEKWNFFFSFVHNLFFLHVYFNVPSVLSVPTSRKTLFAVLPTTNYQILTHMGSNVRCNLWTHLLFQTSTNSQNCASRVLLLFLASESRCGARLPCSLPRSHAAVLGILLIDYHISALIYGWGRHLCATPPPSSASLL